VGVAVSVRQQSGLRLHALPGPSLTLSIPFTCLSRSGSFAAVLPPSAHTAVLACIFFSIFVIVLSMRGLAFQQYCFSIAVPLSAARELGLRLTQCGLGRGLRPFRTRWHLDPSSRLATIDMGRKVAGVVPPFCGASWVVLCPLFGGGTESPSSIMSPGPRPTSASVPSGILIHPVVWPQQTWAENWRGLCPFLGKGKLGPNLTQCGLGPGLPSYKVAS